MKFLRFFVLCLIFMVSIVACKSQVTVIPSTTQVRIDGKNFYLHVVKPGETLFSISRAYNVLQNDIILHNPGAADGIKTGEELKIPVEAEVQTDRTQETDQFDIHITEHGQTVYWLTQNYNITQEELFRHNPSLATSVLQAGQIVRIPRRRTVVSFPVYNPVTSPENNDTVTHPQPAVRISNPDCIEASGNDFRIAMLLPLFLDDNFPPSAPASDFNRDADGRYRNSDGQYWINPRSTNALDFYQGAMLAVDSLKKQGLNAKIDIYDTMQDAAKMTQILNSQALKNNDLIIGPFSTDLVDHVTGFARENDIYYVSPIAMSATSMRNNPYLIQVNSGEINTVASVVDYVSTQKDINVILIINTSEPDQTLFNAYFNILRTVYSENELTVVRMDTDNIQQPNRYLKRGVMNVVIMPSSSEPFVNIVTGQLNASSNSFQINVYGLAIWTKFVNLDLEYLHKLEFRYATAFYIDYDKPSVRDFLKKYRTMYNTEPTMTTGMGGISPNPFHYAFLGYDVTFFFVSVLRRYGEKFGDCIPEFRMDMLQSDFRFERLDPYSGFRNIHFDIYRYTRDYSIIKEIIEN